MVMISRHIMMFTLAHHDARIGACGQPSHSMTTWLLR
jgi:hypothetical protein